MATKEQYIRTGMKVMLIRDITPPPPYAVCTCTNTRNPCKRAAIVTFGHRTHILCIKAARAWIAPLSRGPMGALDTNSRQNFTAEELHFFEANKALSNIIDKLHIRLMRYESTESTWEWLQSHGIPRHI